MTKDVKTMRYWKVWVGGDRITYHGSARVHDEYFRRVVRVAAPTKADAHQAALDFCAAQPDAHNWSRLTASETKEFSIPGWGAD